MELIADVKIAKKEDFERWKTEKLYLIDDDCCSDNLEFLTKKESISKIEENCREWHDGQSFDEYLQNWEDNNYGTEDELFKLNMLYTYDIFFNDHLRPYTFIQNVICDGIEYIIFGCSQCHIKGE